MSWLRSAARRYGWIVVDALGVAGLAAVVVVGIRDTGRMPTLAVVLLLLAQVVPLPWRRRVPVAVLAITAVAGIGLAALHWSIPPAGLTPLLALYALATWSPTM